MKQLNLPFQEGNFDSKEIDDGPTHISEPIRAVMQDVNIRVLVNGIGEAPEGALRNLVRAEISPEVIETKLTELNYKSPDTFTAKRIRETMDWINNRWYKIQQGHQ